MILRKAVGKTRRVRNQLPNRCLKICDASAINRQLIWAAMLAVHDLPALAAYVIAGAHATLLKFPELREGSTQRLLPSRAGGTGSCQ